LSLAKNDRENCSNPGEGLHDDDGDGAHLGSSSLERELNKETVKRTLLSRHSLRVCFNRVNHDWPDRIERYFRISVLFRS